MSYRRVFTLMVIVVMSIIIGSSLTSVQGATYIVDDDGGAWADYTTIQDAINASIGGDTIHVYNGTYFEAVTVHVKTSIFGNGSSDTIIDGADIGNVINITANYCEVSGFTIRNASDQYSGAGIGVSGDGCNITNNSFSDCYGIWLNRSEQIILRNNTMTFAGLMILGNTLSEWDTHTMDTTNVVDGRPIRYWKDRTNDTMPSNTSQAILVSCSNVTMSGLTLEYMDVGIQIAYSDDINTSGNDIHQNQIGIHTFQCQDIRIRNNNISDNIGLALMLNETDESTIGWNRIISNDAFGILMDWCDNNSLFNNEINSSLLGIYVDNSTGNKLMNNSICLHDYYGLYVMHSDWNQFNESEISDNDILAVYTEDSYHNSYFHNNFIDNGWSPQAIDDEGNNTWDNGSVGNYWSDYSGSDSDGDGIGDSDYDLWSDYGAKDRYPLMDPWNGSLPNVSTKPDAKIESIAPSPILYLPDAQHWNSAVAYWQLDEGSGSAINDTSSNGNNGSLNGPSWSKGLWDHGLSFDGSNDIVTISDDDSLDITGNLTIEAWVDVSDISNYDGGLVSKLGGSGNRSYSMRIIANDNRPYLGIQLSKNDTLQAFHGTTDLTTLDDGFHLFTVVYTAGSGAHVEIYIDGTNDNLTKLQGDPFESIDSTDEPIEIGRVYGSSAGPHYYFDGIMDEIMIFNRSFSAEQVLNHYHRLNRTVQYKGNSSESVSIERYVWRSSLDGEFYNGSRNPINHSGLSAGNHSIFLKVQDINGTWSDEVSSYLTVISDQPRTWIVDDDNGSWADFERIQDAINVSSDGDTIIVHSGQYRENIKINHTLSIHGNGSEESTIIGTNSGPTVNITEANANITGFNITQEPASEKEPGMVIINTGNWSIEIDDCVFTNTSDGVYIVDGGQLSEVVFTNCSFIRNNGNGSFIDSSYYVSFIKCVSMNNSFDGIRAEHADYINIFNCTSKGNGNNGITLYYSDRNEVLNCIIMDNDADGIFDWSGYGERIENCTIEMNGNHGIRLALTRSHIYVEECIISNNTLHGLYLNQVKYTWTRYNTFEKNGRYGVYIYQFISGDTRNWLQFNNFIDNYPDIPTRTQAYDKDGNHWDNGSVGNYWSDYNGSDLNGDGIGDDPYFLDGGADANDTYPLMNPWNGRPPVGNDLPVGTIIEVTPYPGIAGMNLTFRGNSSDVDGYVTSYEWTSSIDGLIYNGTEDSITTNILSVGQHNITLRVMDNGSLWSEPVWYHLLVRTDTPQTWIVDDDGGSWADFEYVSDAVNASIDGDTIRVFAGIYPGRLSIDNSISLKGNGSSNTTINGDFFQTSIFITADNVSIAEFRISNGSYMWDGIVVTGCNGLSIESCLIDLGPRTAIRLEDTHESIIQNNNITGNGLGLSIRDGSSNITVINNTFFDNGDGLSLSNRACNNTLSFNNFSRNRCGIALITESSYNTINNNSFDFNRLYSLYVRNGSSFNQIHNNSVVSTDELGIHLLFSSNNNSIINNMIHSNLQEGLYIQLNCTDNRIHQNSFVNNNQSEAQAYDSGYGNHWDNGLIGNFWSDYNGTDANGDGIGDTPHKIGESGEAEDRFPLVEPWNGTLPRGNELPTATIIEILPNPAIEGENITFIGNGTDSDGTVVQYEWSSTLYGKFYNGTENSTIFSGLPVGNQTITLRVMDNGSAWSDPVQMNLTVIKLLPDLSIDDSDIDLSEDKFYLEVPINTSVTVHNIGQADALNVTIRVKRGSAGWAWLNNDIPANSSIEVHHIWTPTYTGEHTLNVTIEYPGEEVTLSNNNATMSFNVTDAPGIDLTVSESTITLNPGIPLPNEEVNISVIVVNNGDQNATDVTVTLLIDDVKQADKVIPVIEGLFFTVEEFKWKAEGIGIHDVTIIVDYYDAIEENVEGNNDATIQFDVIAPPRPDPGFYDHDIVIYPTDPDVDDDILVNITVRKFEDIDILNLSVVLYVDTMKVQERTINITSYASWNLTFEISLSAGDHNLTVIIDPDDLIDEVNETNNVINATITVDSVEVPEEPSPDGDDEAGLFDRLMSPLAMAGLLLIIVVVIVLLVATRRRGSRPKPKRKVPSSKPEEVQEDMMAEGDVYPPPLHHVPDSRYPDEESPQTEMHDFDQYYDDRSGYKEPTSPSARPVKRKPPIQKKYAEPEAQSYAYQPLTLEDEEPEEDVVEEVTVPCPSCGEPLEEGARFCNECGTYLG